MPALRIHSDLGAGQQKKLNYLQYKFTPYFLIALFAGSTAVIRAYIIPEWGFLWHLGSFAGQTLVLTGIWHLIKWLSGRLDHRMPFEQGVLKRMAAQIGLTLALLTPLVLLSIALSRPYWPAFFNERFLAILFMLYVIVIFLFNFSFYVGYFFRNWQISVEEKARLEIQASKLEKEKVELQYHRLRNQVDPHYLFNTLSSLDGLIQTDPELASEFVQHMSKVYRYVLQHKESEIVSLREELGFIENYIKLLHLRYGRGLQIHHTISDGAKERGIVMVTLQVLIDNAIKHNMVLPTKPLKVLIWDDKGYLVVHNNKQLRTHISDSNKHGLKQLKDLYAFLTDKEIFVDENEEHFTIKVPLL